MRILYIDIDSLRPDHLSCYGYLRQTSPNIDALASEGVRFTNLFATDTPCLPSRTAFFGGQFGLRTGVVNHGGVYADLPLQGIDRGFHSDFSQQTLASVLRRAGYHTASISPFPNRHTAYQVWYGFNETYDTGKRGKENGDEMYPPARRWLKENGSRDNWFLHVNFWDPHTPYDHPVSFGDPFAEEPIESWITEELLARQNASFGPHSSREVAGYTDELPPDWRMGAGTIESLEDARRHLNGYDTGILYADFYVGKLIQDLRDLGIYDDTAIILCADHGENQGELNIWGDHQTADLATNRLPLIMRWPGQTEDLAGQTQDGLYYHLDLGATLVDWGGGEVPSSWDGRSFGADLHAQGGGREYLVISQGAWSCQRSVRWDQWLLMRTYHTGLKEFPAYMLFDVERDPHQTDNLAASRPEQVGRGLYLLDEWMGAQMPRAQRGDPFWGIIQEGGPFHANCNQPSWAAYLQRLHATGRGHHAERLAVMDGQPFTSGLD